MGIKRRNFCPVKLMPTWQDLDESRDHRAKIVRPVFQWRNRGRRWGAKADDCNPIKCLALDNGVVPIITA
jgi:hypothetical protein